jgi:Flp pilus assembly pilin Flp
MFIPLWGVPPQQPDETQERLQKSQAPPTTKRRGVTSLEYLAAASLILVALILAVQHLGIVTGGLFTNNAAATSKTVQSGP